MQHQLHSIPFSRFLLDQTQEIVFEVSNREWAAFFWLTAFIAWILLQKKTRDSILRMISLFFSPQILTAVLLMLSYVSTEIFLAKKMRLWELTDLKDTFYWLIVTAFVLLVNATKASEDKNFFKKLLKDNIKFGIILEFIVGLYSFSLSLEFLLIPIVIVLSLVSVAASLDVKNEPAKKLADLLLTAFGLWLVIHSLQLAFQDPNKIVNIESLRSIFLIPILTIAYFPFIYLIALFAAYQNIYVRLGLSRNLGKSFRLDVLQVTLWTCNISFDKLKKISGNLNKLNLCQGTNEIQEIIRRLLAPPKPLIPTKFSIEGQWYTNDAFGNGHRNSGTRTDYYFTSNQMREISNFPDGGGVNYLQRYDLSSLEESTRLIKLITYSTNGDIFSEMALQLSEDLNEIRTCFMDEDSDVVDFSDSMSWRRV